MAVAVDLTGQVLDSTTNVSSLSYTMGGAGVGSGSNRALVIIVGWSNGGAFPSSVSVTWDNGGTNQAMTLRASQTTISSNSQVSIYVLRNPTAGNKTCLVSWTNAANVSVCGISFTGVNQTSDALAFPNPNQSNGNSSSASLAITSAVGNIPVTGVVSAGATSAPNQTQIFLDTAPTDDVGGQRAAGASSVTFTWTIGTNFWGMAGCDVAAAAAAAPALVLPRRVFLKR